MISARCLVHDDDGRVLLVRHRHWNDWGLPGGVVNKGELIVESGQATLPGAEVIDVAVLDPDNNVWPTSNTTPICENEVSASHERWFTLTTDRLIRAIPAGFQ